MMSFYVLDSMEALDASIKHYDPTVFPDDSDWYRRFEHYISAQSSNCRTVCGVGVENSGSVLLPLQLSVNSQGTSTLSSLDNYYSVDYRPLCSTESARRQIGPLVVHVLKTQSPDIFCLRSMNRGAPETDLIMQALIKSGWRVYQSVNQINWVHDFHGDFDDYVSSRPSRLKNTLRRKTAKLMNLPGITLTIHDGKHDLEGLLSAYNHIYERSWKVPEPHPEFVPQLIRAMAERGHLRLGLLKIHGVPVAAHFWVVKQQIAFIYKLAHDKAYDQYSLGTVLMGQMIKSTMEVDGVKRLDFLSGDDRYKQDWMSERREKMMIRAYNPRSARAQILRLRNEHVIPFAKRLFKFRPLVRNRVGLSQ